MAARAEAGRREHRPAAATSYARAQTPAHILSEAAALCALGPAAPRAAQGAKRMALEVAAMTFVFFVVASLVLGLRLGRAAM